MKKLLITLCVLACTGFVVHAEPDTFYQPPTEAKLQYNQGIDFYKAGQLDKAMASFRQAIDIDKNYIDAYYNLGSILEYLKQDERALAVFKQIIVRNPNDYESVYRAAYLSEKLGQYDNAKDFLTLIPKTSSMYGQAQDLAWKLNSDMQTLKAKEAEERVPSKIEQTNGMYNDIVTPTGITTDSNGNVYIACYSGNAIYKITPDGKKLLFVKDVKINGPISMVSDKDGNIYVSNYNADNVVKISKAGTITVIVSNIAKPYGLHVTDGLLFVSSQGSNSVLRYKL